MIVAGLTANMDLNMSAVQVVVVNLFLALNQIQIILFVTLILTGVMFAAMVMVDVMNSAQTILLQLLLLQPLPLLLFPLLQKHP
jgi:hypothetical protein